MSFWYLIHLGGCGDREITSTDVSVTHDYHNLTPEQLQRSKGFG